MKQAIEGASPGDGLPAASIRLDHPGSGIGFGGPSGVESPIHLLGLVLDPAAERATGERGDRLVPIDRWVRGDDVVAVYEPRDPRSLRATAMWRRWPTGSTGVTAWELVVSCQTSLLESDATVVVRTLVPASRIAAPPTTVADRPWPDAAESLPSTAALARTSSGPSVLVAAHPLDARRLTLMPPSDGQPKSAGGSKVREPAAIECWLFPSVVEKGVLLRGRVLAAVGPREHDTDWSADLLDRFAASPPPLTT